MVLQRTRTHLAQYWTRGFRGGPAWMPALLATKHWLGTPSMLSVARLTSLYSSAPAQEGIHLVGRSDTQHSCNASYGLHVVQMPLSWQNSACWLALCDPVHARWSAPNSSLTPATQLHAKGHLRQSTSAALPAPASLALGQRIAKLADWPTQMTSAVPTEVYTSPSMDAETATQHRQPLFVGLPF